MWWLTHLLIPCTPMAVGCLTRLASGGRLSIGLSEIVLSLVVMAGLMVFPTAAELWKDEDKRTAFAVAAVALIFILSYGAIVSTALTAEAHVFQFGKEKMTFAVDSYDNLEPDREGNIPDKVMVPVFVASIDEHRSELNRLGTRLPWLIAVLGVVHLIWMFRLKNAKELKQ